MFCQKCLMVEDYTYFAKLNRLMKKKCWNHNGWQLHCADSTQYNGKVVILQKANHLNEQQEKVSKLLLILHQAQLQLKLELPFVENFILFESKVRSTGQELDQKTKSSIN